MDEPNFKGRDLISINDFSLDEINYVLDYAKNIKENPDKIKNKMRDKLMAPLFFEPSTRTASSFQVAMLNLGGNVLDFDVNLSSILKGETLRDTVKTIENYGPDIVAMRHKKDGSVRFVADILNTPVINAGDGQNQHPTQTLLDLYSIREIRGKIDGTKIAMAGDLKYGRVPHSLALALSRYKDCEIIFISPDSLKMPKDLLEKLRKKGVRFSEFGLEKLNEISKEVDILLMTRVQRERFPEGPDGDSDYEKVSKKYQLKKSMIENVHSNFRVLHPLPKVMEIEDEIDYTKYAYYFQQAKNGLYIRQALVLLLTGESNGKTL